MSVMDNHGVVCVRMSIPAVRKKNYRAEIHRAAPELREAFVLNANVFHLFRIGRRLYQRHFLIHRYLNFAAASGIDMDLDGFAIEVAGLSVPVLAFSLIHRHFYRTAIGAMER